ncbi:MAG: tetratricopeptide repeat protein [Candidatus Thorarchaeota archaeon]
MTSSEIKELIQANQLREEGKIKDAYQIVLELEKRSNLTLKEKLSCKLLKANLLGELGNFMDAIKCAEDLFEKFLEQGDNVSAFDALIIQGTAYTLTVNLAKAEAIIKHAEDLLKIIKETIPLDLRERQSKLLKVKAAIIFFQGDIQHSLELNKRAYELVKDSGKFSLIGAILNNIADKYHHLKEYDKAITYAKKAIECNFEPSLIYALGTLIEIYISKGDIQEAEVILELLREHTEKLNTKRYKTLYYFSKAMILKSSLRARDRIKAEDIFKELALNDSLLSEPRINAILSLCDLYLTELRITNDVKIINEIQPYIKTLLNIAEQRHLYLYLAETYLLQAKLSLLTSDIKNAKRFLIQAQKIAESYGLEQLAMKISYEHDELLRQTKIWENFKESEIPLSEGLDLTGLDKQMEYMAKKRVFQVPKFPDEEPVLLLIVSEGGVPFFTQSFIEDKSFEDHLFGGFFTAINSFINEMFSEGLDRAFFGEHTLLMNSFAPFLMCYIYKGQSYSAQKRLKSFIEELKRQKDVWATFEKFYRTSRKIQLKDIPSLEPLIKEIFIEKKLG